MYNGSLQDMTCSQRQQEEETQDRDKMSSQKIEKVHTIGQCIIKISYRKAKTYS